ncbi:MAG: hypothetical protein HQL70_01820 [Magnetococcales bacterium]|nr:hypothetical protein [Magnetococcales bacterium]
MKTKIVSELAADQSLVLSGPGYVKLNVAKSVTISKLGGSTSGIGQVGSLTAVKLGATIPALGPIFGFVILSAGALLLVKQWIKKVDSGECQ